MEKFYSVIRYITYPAVYIRKAVEFLLCVILKIDPSEELEELPFDEVIGHTPHGEFLFPLKSAVYNILVFALQLAGALGFYGTAVTALCYLDVELINPATAQIDVMFFVHIIFMYLGISFISNLCPSANSVENFWALCITEGGFISRVIFIIPALILRLLSLLENLGITAILSVVAPIILKIVF